MQVLRLLLICVAAALIAGEDFYEMLGIPKDADNRAIRRAFKKLAIQLHPDKNPDDEEAHAKFVKLNRAYEVLKDEELRKKYDEYGEEGLKDDFQPGNKYQSWQFYKDNFGIYDDDIEIVTLSRADFQQAVLDSGDLWFVNFYSTFCSHCHQLAPTWREFAREMDGVIRIGAVNCAEDPMLCQSQNVMGYPSLVLYPGDGQHAIFYQGHRELQSLLAFVMQRFKSEVHRVTFKNYISFSQEWDQYSNAPWVIDFCDDDEQCLSKQNRRKLAAMLRGVANVGSVKCKEGDRDLLCKKLRDSGVAFYPAGQIDQENEKELSSFDPKELLKEVISFIPDWPVLSPEEYRDMFNEFAASDNPTLVRFTKDAKADEEEGAHADLKKMQFLLEDIDVAIADCSILNGACDSIKLVNYPTYVMFKPSGGYEIDYRKKHAFHDVLVFAKESSQSTLITLTDEQYQEALDKVGEEMWIIDYFAPWCPPCMRMIPELRKLPESVGDIPLKKGTIDCTIHKEICQKAGVTSYPSAILRYEDKEFRNIGFHDVHQILEFIDDALNPSVEVLDGNNFGDLVGAREEDELWLVDFYAPWCGPCQQLMPEFKRLARQMRKQGVKVNFGTLDCDANRAFCTQQGVRAYPLVRLYPANPNHRAMDYPNNWWRDAPSMARWLTEFLPSLVAKMGNEFYQEVLGSTDVWLVDFYAPWCGHCVQFAPIFEEIAQIFEGRVKLAKIDCDKYPGVCQTAGIRAYPSIRLYLGGPGNGERQEPQGIMVQSQHRDAVVNIVEQFLAQRQHDEL
ncbi:hypothetical protein L596_009103 [Steinernema carpocapsae]|uniref:DnaJ homolog subfamily C member 10 n=1 Tax=Steinernema carpocapsae TaxID=34508 RepID=A0A4U5PF81_STECR|nr:hypothetical protein L596_009103 [Steinernema carpocapsae]